MPSKDAYDRIVHQGAIEKLAALGGRESRGAEARD